MIKVATRTVALQLRSRCFSRPLGQLQPAPDDRPRLLRRLENMRIHTGLLRSIYVSRAVVEEQCAPCFATQCGQARVIDFLVRLDDAQFARPCLYVELIQPVELS